MDSLSDDLFLSTLELDDIIALDQKGTEKDSKQNTTANTSASDNCVEFDDDDDIYFMGDVINQAVVNDCKPGTSKSMFEVDKGQGHATIKKFESTNLNQKEEKPGPSSLLGSKSKKGKGDKRSDWELYQDWFEKQETFKTPWFQTIPISTLFVSQCKSILQSSIDERLLLQFAKMLVSFLRECKDDGGYRKDTINLVEMMLLRLETDLVDKPFTKADSRCYLNAILEDITQGYVTGDLQLETSRIPELLTSLYPKAFNDIMQKVVTTMDVNLLLPVCSNSTSNFLKIMQFLHSGEIFKTLGFSEDDPDFENCSSDKPLKIATSLLDSLKSKLGTEFFKVLPSTLQPIFVLDSVINRNTKVFGNSDAIIAEMYRHLNDLFCSCSSSTTNNSVLNSKEFLQFLLNLLPVTSGILSDKKLVKNIKFKTYPYLWMSLRNSTHFS